MAYYRDLREFLAFLEPRGKVYRFTEPIDKDSELMPLFRLQLRGLPEADRKVFVFENVRNASGATYDMGVAAGVYGASEELVALGMGCASYPEMLERWHEALERPLAPVVVDRGPVQEVVQMGDELQRVGLDALPVPVEEVGFSQVLRIGMPIVTVDPETGIRNVGTYNAFLRDRDRLVAAIANIHDAMRYHWQTARRRTEDLPIAIVIGATPNVMAVGSAGIPYGVDELAVAGAIAGEPMDLVRCVSIPLEVPAHAEIVVEGVMSTRTMEPRLAFGEYPGFMNVEQNHRPIMRVTAITHRKQALFTPIQVGYPPTDHNATWALANAAMLYHQLRYQDGFPVEEVYFPQAGAGNDLALIRLQKNANVDGARVLEAAAERSTRSKYLIALDFDVNTHDMDQVFWALNYRVRPETGIVLRPGRSAGLDPSVAPVGASKGRMDSAGPPGQYHRVLIDATAKGPQAPLGIARRDFMERALAIWHQHADLPALQLRAPWYGYDLGHWSAEDQRLADLIVQGDYRAVGRLMADQQVPVEQVLQAAAPPAEATKPTS
jgi:UbiD family decarboxylase